MYILCVCLTSLCAVLFNLLIFDTEINKLIKPYFDILGGRHNGTTFILPQAVNSMHIKCE